MKRKGRFWKKTSRQKYTHKICL